METKQIIESLIKDLYGNKSLPEVFLKLQVIVHKLKNEQLTEWFNNENNGYDEEKILPQYRNLHFSFFAQVEQNRGNSSVMINCFHLPTDLIEDKKTRDMVSILPYGKSISNITNLISNEKNETIRMTAPCAMKMISLFKRNLSSNCHIHQIWVEIPTDVIKNIISQVRIKLMGFLLEINENLNLNISFTEEENKEKIEKAFYQHITNNIYGNNNSVATGQNVEQNIVQNFVDYKKLKEYGVEEKQIEELKIIEGESDKNALRGKVLNWFSSVSAAIAARGVYENIPSIMESIKSLFIN